MKTALFSAIFLLFSIVSFSNNLNEGDHFVLKHFDVCYEANDTSTTSSIIEIQNISTENVWIFVEQDLDVTDHDLIVNRFLRRNGGDMNLFQWMSDGNVHWESFCANIYDKLFFKILEPNSSFYFVELRNEKQTKALINQIRVFSSQKLRSIFNPLTKFPALTLPSYQPNIIILYD